MARPKIPTNQKLRDVPAKITPETYEAIQKLADKYEWSVSKVARKAIEKGLEVWFSDINTNQPQAGLLSIKD